ncbi:MAG TPA: type ISP restriction/modification enzyme [Gaiellaceae bacterium]|jgi:hypothetical protein|nr:type ISP restriction/modification enzyme [Gaiellaceae bacterium]
MAAVPEPPLLAALRRFGAAVTAIGDLPQAADPLKGPMQRLLYEAGEKLGRRVVARLVAIGFAVESGDVLVGHVELKAPGKGAPVDHPNLVSTDGNEWALFRGGARVGQVVRAAGDVRTDRAAAYDAAAASVLETLLRDFFGWEPLVPTSPKALAETLAPLTRLLRENVRTALAQPGSALGQLAEDWRGFFFPEADDAQFADAYAQTVTYALLLARVEGERLDERHAPLAEVLRVLAEPAARREVEVGLDLLERVVAAVDPEALTGPADRDLWLYFYEDFLAAYDGRTRRRRGVYYTPPAVVHAQTVLVSELLEERFGKELGFAADDVVVLDPAMGTGTYLLAAMNDGLERVRQRHGPGAVATRASIVARNFHGFELLIGSYAVARLRFSQQIAAAGGVLPEKGAHIYLADTLASANGDTDAEAPVLVCVGNPPYFRDPVDEEGEQRGGWVRRSILRDFLRDTPGVHTHNLYNLYVYFWRWALWKVFESGPRCGVVSFISAASYLRGPGFAGMRRHMRETFDDLWILDLGGENRGARRSENVFEIQTPVAIAVGVRSPDAEAGTPARVHYARLEGSRDEKYAQLLGIRSFEDVAWQPCYSGWLDPLLPEREADFFSWPPLTDLLPWRQPGVKVGRTWPIAPTRDELVARWKALLAAAIERRTTLFKNSPTGRKAHQPAQSLPPHEARLDPVESTTEPESPATVPYAFRSFDRQYLIPDARIIDRPCRSLWATASARQLYMTSLLTDVLGSGPAAVATHLVPDLHHFSGRGGKDVVPLWRDAEGRRPNLATGLLDVLAERLGLELTPEDVFAYCYAVLSAPAYVERFAQELEIPGPRVPLTRDAQLFRRAIELGRELVWLHTFGERFVPAGRRAGELPQGRARAQRPVSALPERHRYDAERQELYVGDGVFAPVEQAVRDFRISDLDVVGSWLDYRMKDGAGRRSSPLDEIRTEVWPAAFTEELLRLLWILERTVALHGRLDELLDEIVAGDCFDAAELPAPTSAERAPPAIPRSSPRARPAPRAAPSPSRARAARRG